MEPSRPLIHAHCYRMLGSAHEADDAVQETWLRAWRAVGQFEGRSAFGSWLYRIATNVCLDQLASRTRRELPIHAFPAADATVRPTSVPLADSVWVEPYADAQVGVSDGYASPDARYELRESVELAFVAALQYLPPRQRAALLLRDVLGFTTNEAAEALEVSTASINSALQHARAATQRLLPERSQQETPGRAAPWSWGFGGRMSSPGDPLRPPRVLGTMRPRRLHWSCSCARFPTSSCSRPLASFYLWLTSTEKLHRTEQRQVFDSILPLAAPLGVGLALQDPPDSR